MSDHSSEDELAGLLREQERGFLRHKKLAKKILALLASGGLEALEDLPPRSFGPGLLEALLRRSWALRYEDPGLMIQLCLLATQVAKRLNVRYYGSERVADFQCCSWSELGNAYRVADQLSLAEAALSYADELSLQGTGDKLLGIRLLNFQASLAGDRLKFGLACTALSLLHDFYSSQGDSHRAGRALIGKGLYTGYAGRPAEAIQLLSEGFALIDKNREPSLTYAAVHNQVTFLIDCRRADEANRFLFLNRKYTQGDIGRINLLRMTWEEGRIDAGLGKLEPAQRAFKDVRQRSQEVGRPYDTALVSLDLAAVLMKQNRVGEAHDLVMEAAKVFAALRIEREALGAVLLLKKSFEARHASPELVEEVAAFVRRAQNDPDAKFDPKPR